MISVRGLTKRYGDVRAVDDLTFDVAAGKVHGFLGPNGAGKSTTMRLIMGLDRPTAGIATVNAKRYVELAAPLSEVGALLDAGAMHPGRTGRAHLRIGALHQRHLTSSGRGGDRPGRTRRAASRRIKGYSLGMRQRVGIAAALLGDPPVLLFDEPVNGLDLDGVRWIRALLRGFADEGRTVLVSSHLMSEMQLIADRVVIIGRGRLIADADIDEVLGGLGGQRVRVRTPEGDALHRGLTDRAVVERTGSDELEVQGLSATEIGDLAHAIGVPVHHLAEVEQSLERAYLSLTEDSIDYHGHAAEPIPNGATP
jgi:ABC-2 type transport system ATP-binding protein